METFEQLAQEAYQEFLCERKRQGSRSTDYINWQMLSPEQQASWIAATRHIVEQAKQVH